MELADERVRIVLRPTGYQFPGTTAEGLDADWLRVVGEVDDNDLRWTFDDPCLLADDAREVAAWLRRSADVDDGEVLGFTEPNLSFSVRARSADTVTVGIGFDLECSPPSSSRTVAGEPYLVEVSVSPDALRRAAAEWSAELAAFPARSR